MKIEYTAKVKDGKMTLINRKFFDKELENFEGQTVTVTIEKKKHKRSDQQNKYYWGVVVPIVTEGIKETGEIVTTDQVHEFLKFTFLSTGEKIKFARSTTDLSTTDFLLYIDQIQIWASEFLNCYIPDPDEFK